MSEQQDFLDRYQNKFGENLGDILSAMAQYEGNVTMCYNRVHEFINDYITIRNYTYSFDDLLDTQKELIKDAVIYQAFYIAHGVDFSQISGYSATSGALLDNKAIEERELAITAKRKIIMAEVLYRIKGVPRYNKI